MTHRAPSRPREPSKAEEQAITGACGIRTAHHGEDLRSNDPRRREAPEGGGMVAA